jgi:hypothetical protein
VRTVGMIFSVVMVFIVSLLSLLAGALAANIVISFKNRTGQLDLFPILATIVLIGFGGWGVTAGFGIIKLRERARTSVLAFSTVLLAIAACGTAKMVVDPSFGLSYLEGVYLGSIRVEIAAFLVWFAALGGFWLYFFTRNNVRTQFSR